MIIKIIRSIIVLPFTIMLWPFIIFGLVIGIIIGLCQWVITGERAFDGRCAPSKDEMVYMLLFPYSAIKTIMSQKGESNAGED